LREYWECDGNR